MRRGKEKCEILKAIRAYVADRYGVEYSPSECHHQGECRGTCSKCDAELAELQEQLEAKGVSDIAEDAELAAMVRSYLDRCQEEDSGALPSPGDRVERTEGMPMQGDIAVEEEGNVQCLPLEGDVPCPPVEKRRLFLECNIAGAAFYHIDEIWGELHEGTKLFLVREKDNVHDENAVAVALACKSDEWSDDFEAGRTLGYIPRAANKSLATLLDMGWQDMFEAEICELREHVPYSDRIHILVYVKNKDMEEEPEGDDNRLRMVVVTEEAKWQLLSDELWQKGYTYFRWGGFPPWRLDLPEKGDKVVFMYNSGEQYFMYLMQTIAIGEQSIPFLNNVNELFQVDDCTVYVLSNVVGPVVVEKNALNVPQELLKGKYQPDERVSQSLSDRLLEIFVSRQYFNGSE